MATQDMAQINKPIVSQIFSYLDFKHVSLHLEILTRLSLSFLYLQGNGHWAIDKIGNGQSSGLEKD